MQFTKYSKSHKIHYSFSNKVSQYSSLYIKDATVPTRTNVSNGIYPSFDGTKYPNGDPFILNEHRHTYHDES